MTNRMEELDKIFKQNQNKPKDIKSSTESESDKIQSLNISQDKTTQQYISRSETAKPQGKLKMEIYDNYYDMSNTITTAQTTDPNDPDNPNYNREPVFESIERNAPFIWVSNDAPLGGATLFVLASHRGGQHFSRERPIYPKEIKRYYNIYELRLRSALQGLSYRVSEYEIQMLT